MRAALSWPHLILVTPPKAPLPNTIPLWGRVSRPEFFLGGHKHSVHNTCYIISLAICHRAICRAHTEALFPGKSSLRSKKRKMHTSLQDPRSVSRGHPLISPTILGWIFFISEHHTQRLCMQGGRRASALAHSVAQDLGTNHKLVPKGHENIPVICSDKSWIRHFQVIWCSV